MAHSLASFLAGLDSIFINSHIRRSKGCSDRAEKADGGSTLKEKTHVGNDAANAGSGRSFWTPDPFLEPENGAIYIWPSQQDPYHQSRKNPGDVPGGDELCAATGSEQ